MITLLIFLETVNSFHHRDAQCSEGENWFTIPRLFSKLSSCTELKLQEVLPSFAKLVEVLKAFRRGIIWSRTKEQIRIRTSSLINQSSAKNTHVEAISVHAHWACCGLGEAAPSLQPCCGRSLQMPPQGLGWGLLLRIAEMAPKALLAKLQKNLTETAPGHSTFPFDFYLWLLCLDPQILSK